MLLGDAAGFFDPITGGGMTQALQTAELLAAYLCQAELTDDRWLVAYDQARSALLRDYQRLTWLLLQLGQHRGLARTILRALRHTPWLFSHLLGVATGMQSIFRSGPANRPQVLSDHNQRGDATDYGHARCWMCSTHDERPLVNTR
ncbi:MAG: hypothetical protein M3R24_06245 [Chloroflexota bacterium]|nr:hypothetical protein [Chloroflexota bacterium]